MVAEPLVAPVLVAPGLVATAGRSNGAAGAKGATPRLQAERADRWTAEKQELFVTRLAETGNVTAALADTGNELDIDANGCGRVRFLLTAARAVVRYQAGSGAGWADIPGGLRQGILRLVSHWYVYRERDEAPAQPAVVAALWRPERRMRLS